MKKLIFAVIPIIFCNPAMADGAHDLKCDSPLQQDLMDCFRNAFNKSDMQLNKLYQKLIVKAKKADNVGKGSDDNAGSYESNLRASEKAWIAFRDAECTRTSSPNRALYGLEGDFDYLNCQAYMTGQRIKQLSEAVSRGTSDH